MNRSCAWALGLCLVLAGLACSSQSGGAGAARRVLQPQEPGAAPADTIISEPLCGADNPFCSSTQAGPNAAPAGPPAGCGALPIDLTPAGVNIMLAVDGALSMEPRWSNIVTAIRSLRAANPDAAFGLHTFWADAINPLDFEMTQQVADMSNNACLELHDEVLELGDHSADELINFLGSAPRGGSIGGFYQVSPVIEPLNRYLEADNPLADPSRTNYLVVFTGGNDNCFGSAFAAQSDKALAYRQLASELHRRNIRVIPVGVDEPSDVPADPFAALFGPGLEGTNVQTITTDYAALGSMLEFGGTGLQTVPRVDTSDELTKLVAVVGQTVGNCRFEVPDMLDSSMSINTFAITFTVSGVEVPRDRSERDGWNFVEGSTREVEFFGQACEAIQTGLSVEANKSCDLDVCGQAAVSVTTKPRVVLLLLDSSASRIECADGTLGCLSTPGTPNRTPSYWEVVQHAVGEVLVAPVNADVAFGMQFFPAKTSAALSCEVATAPEIEPAERTQIKLMQAMLEKLPFGFSPVVGVLESAAANPGRLADPDVVGAVVLLSDGGDNCSGEQQPEIVARLGAAASKLNAAGVQTFAIRYGSEAGKTPEQDEQLAAIVNNGGTATMDTATPYIDAETPEELIEALAGISDRLATCSFALGDVDSLADRDHTNLYLDGVQIGFDAAGTKETGWSWQDAAQTTIVLHGEACEAYKSSRETDVLVEFGCEAVTVQ